MKKAPAPPPKYINKIREMRPGAYIFFRDANPDSVKAIASRVGKQSEPERQYTTRNDGNGVSCWRET